MKISVATLKIAVFVIAVAVGAALIYYLDFSADALACKNKGGQLFGNGDCVLITMEVLK